MHRAEDRGQQVVEVVRHAAGEAPERFQPLRLGEVGLGRLAPADFGAQRGERRLFGPPAPAGMPGRVAERERGGEAEQAGDQRVAPPLGHDQVHRQRHRHHQRLLPDLAERGQPLLPLAEAHQRDAVGVGPADRLRHLLLVGRAVQVVAVGRVGDQHLAIGADQREGGPAGRLHGLPLGLEIAGQHRADGGAVEAAIRRLQPARHDEGDDAGQRRPHRRAEGEARLTVLEQPEVVAAGDVERRVRPEGAEDQHFAIRAGVVQRRDLGEALVQRAQPAVQLGAMRRDLRPVEALDPVGHAVEHQRIGLDHFQGMLAGDRREASDIGIGLCHEPAMVVPGGAEQEEQRHQ